MESLLLRVYNSETIKKTLHVLDKILVILGAFGYLACLYLAYKNSLTELIKILVFSAVPFALVSAFRFFFNAPRPYEIYRFFESSPKAKHGKSFPSRHAFSAFIIATLAFNFSVPLGVLLSISALLLSLSRVLLGIHFIRDVVAGALVGAISGVIAILLI